MAEKITLTRKEFLKPMWRMQFFPMSTINYERFQTLQYACAMAPVLEKLWPNKEDRIEAAERMKPMMKYGKYLGLYIIENNIPKPNAGNIPLATLSHLLISGGILLLSCSTNGAP